MSWSRGKNCGTAGHKGGATHLCQRSLKRLHEPRPLPCLGKPVHLTQKRIVLALRPRVAHEHVQLMHKRHQRCASLNRLVATKQIAGIALIGQVDGDQLAPRLHTTAHVVEA